MIFVFFLISIISFVLTWRSMRDFNLPKELKDLLNARKIKGTIIFFKNKVKHYSSSSSGGL